MAIKGLSNITADKLYGLLKPVQRGSHTDVIMPLKTKSEYSKERDKLLREYLEREPFEYNINTDKLYSQYADMYKKQGEAAMRDAVAQAASKTGGYGSSYGVTAGSQAYQGYLDKLNEIVPELEGRAYDRYTDTEKSLREKADMLDALDTKEYKSYRDTVQDNKDAMDYYRKVYEYDNDYDFDVYKALTDYILSVAKLENSDYYSDRDLELALAKLDYDNYHKELDYDIALKKLLYG